MDDKKDTKLKKYLEKKKKQKTRDEIMSKIVELSKNRKQTTNLRITPKKLPQEDSFEAKLFEHTDDSSYDMNEQCNDDLMSCPQINIVDNSIEYKNTVADDLSSDIINCNVDQSESTVEPIRMNKLMEINEIFEVKRLSDRTQDIQEQRMKLDIFYEESEIISQIKGNIITFIQGETGCGKTTQIPQFLYENGFANNGMICITQPRRFSAISISDRINIEANQKISGYKIKYENNVTAETRIKVVTEGVLFREIQADFMLKEYSVIILDEVHERSTNMDVLIGLLTKIANIRLEQKIPLRIVLMSATVDPEHFKPVLGEFKLIRLNTKMFPVSVFFEDKTDEDYVSCAFNKIKALLESEKKFKNNRKVLDFISKEINNDYSASILVFLTSKDEIYMLKSMLETLERNVVVLPLHSGLNKSEQAKVYEKYLVRKIVLATNIAETSITINDIVFVIDCGREKRKIMDQNTVVYRIGYISKGSARQRMGRTGRTGVCYRLYDGDTFEAFTDQSLPQILMEPFDSVLLQLKNMGIKNVFGFPFIDRPSNEMIDESVCHLQLVGGLNLDGNITKLGREMCAYPVSPRYARLLLLNKNARQSIFEKLVVIVSILSSNFEIRKSEETKTYYTDSKSDLLVYLKIFIEFQRSKKRISSLSGVSIEKLEEIRKLSLYLLRISGMNGNLLNIELDREEENEICKCLYYLFADQLAVNMGRAYLFKDGDIFISKDSIDTNDQNIVFDYLVCSAKKCYAKNITVVSLDWFK